MLPEFLKKAPKYNKEEESVKEVESIVSTPNMVDESTNQNEEPVVEPKESIRVLIADVDQSNIDKLVSIVNSCKDYEFEFYYAYTGMMVSESLSLKPDLLVMDFALPAQMATYDSLSIANQLLATNSNISAAIVCNKEIQPFVIQRGVENVLDKHFNEEEVFSLIKRVSENKKNRKDKVDEIILPIPSEMEAVEEKPREEEALTSIPFEEEEMPKIQYSSSKLVSEVYNRGRVYAIVGPGGSGRNLITANLAAIVSKSVKNKDKVLFLELDTPAADAYFVALDDHKMQSLAYHLKKEYADGHFQANCFSRMAWKTTLKNLSVISGFALPEEANQISFDIINQLIEEARIHYDYIFVKSSYSLMPLHNIADSIIHVCPCNRAQMRNISTILQIQNETIKNFAEKTRVIVNMASVTNPAYSQTNKFFGKFPDEVLAGFINYDSSTAENCITEVMTAIEHSPGSILVKDLVSLAKKLELPSNGFFEMEKANGSEKTNSLILYENKKSWWQKLKSKIFG